MCLSTSAGCGCTDGTAKGMARSDGLCPIRGSGVMLAADSNCSCGIRIVDGKAPTKDGVADETCSIPAEAAGAIRFGATGLLPAVPLPFLGLFLALGLYLRLKKKLVQSDLDLLVQSSLVIRMLQLMEILQMLSFVVVLLLLTV